MSHGFDLSSPLVCEGIIGDGCGGGRIFFVRGDTLFTYDPTTKTEQILLKDLPNANSVTKKVCEITIECEDEQIVFDLSLLRRVFRKKELIIYDFDGTLIDSVPDLALALNLMLEDIEFKTFNEESIRHWVGNGAQTLVKRALSGAAEIDKNLDNELFERALEIFLQHYEKNACVSTTIYPNVKETLESFYKDGYKQAIVTNKPYKFIQPILKGLEIEHYFEYYIGGDSLELKKPSPEPLYHVCKKLDIDVAKSIMVGDSKNDIISANSAKMDVVGVSYGYNYGEDIGVHKPSIVIDDIKELVDIVV